MNNTDNTVNINSPLYKDTVGTEWETEEQKDKPKPSKVKAKVLGRIRKKIANKQ